MKRDIHTPSAAPEFARKFTDGYWRVPIFIHEAHTEHFAHGLGYDKETAAWRAQRIVDTLHAAERRAKRSRPSGSGR